MQLEIDITDATAREAIRRCGSALRAQREWRDGKRFAFVGTRSDEKGRIIATYMLVQE